MSRFNQEYRHPAVNPDHPQPFAALAYNTQNLGDEIQSLASSRFMYPSSGVDLVHRDYLQSSHLPAKVKLMMNGWFMHDTSQWPPDPSIEPIFTGFHIANNGLLSSDGIAYLMKHAPIGCRDIATVQKLEDRGIAAYFSGCPTLTLNAIGNTKSDEVIMVDCEAQHPDMHIQSVSKLVEKYIPMHIRRRAVHISHNVPSRWKNLIGLKLSKAIRLLRRYSSAKLVITSRLHCAFPCLAMGVPCILLNHHWQSDDRFAGYRDRIVAYDGSQSEIAIDWDTPAAQDISTLRVEIESNILQAIRARG